MFTNYFTLYHLAQELNRLYRGAVIAEVYSQEKNTLSIVVYRPEPHTITISCLARKNFIVAREGMFRSRKNSIDLFASLINTRIHAVYIDAQDRIVYLRTDNDRFLLAELFGARANVVLCDEKGTVIDAFLSKKELVGAHRTLQYEPLPLTVEQFLPSPEFMRSAFSTNEPAVRVLKNIIPKLGSELAEEILYRAGISKNSLSLSTEQITTIYSQTQILLRELLQPTHRITPMIYFDNSTPVVCSPIPLRRYSELRATSYDTIVTALQHFLRYDASADSFNRQKKELLQWLNREKTRTERTLAAVEKELSSTSRAADYELFGKLLMANLPSLSKGMRSVVLQNSFSNNEEITVALDPTLTPVQNAERYFNKAKRAKSAHDEAAERLSELQRRKQVIELLLQQAGDTDDGASLKKFLHLHTTELRHLGYMTEQEQKELPPFKIFTVDGGFTVYAGKNSENNDLLTQKYAKPNDLWFHARGSSGSHVVLKVGTGKGKPTKKSIEQAAAIAAYYSKMKNATQVPVAMTEKKYVRKPKGAPAGTVVIEKEKVILVPPGLPEGTSSWR